MENSRCISMPGLPLKVGNSGDMVWVRSTTVVKLFGAAVAVPPATPVAANPAAAADLMKPRRVTASLTARSHPAKHISFPLVSATARPDAAVGGIVAPAAGLWQAW